MIYNYSVTCRKRNCENENIPIRLGKWDGSPIWCGACSSPINAEAACWHTPPEPEFDKVEHVRDMLASLTEEEWDRLRDVR